MKNNIGELFYKEYYKGVNFEYIFKKDIDGDNEALIKANEALIKVKNDNLKDSELLLIENPVTAINKEKAELVIKAKIAYPGLVTGIGLIHDSKGLKGAFNLGMHFDYTTGMPVVYGSSVKGVLRDYFTRSYCKDTEYYDDDLFRDIYKEKEIDVKDLFEDIFNGKKRDKSKDVIENGVLKKGYVFKSIYERDIFFDAVITEAYSDGREIHLLEDDSITPHTEGPLKNPIPITMLKIAPGCEIEFRFLLHKYKFEDKEFGAEEKIELFEKILKAVGVGAKTNVGYGQLE